MNANTISLTDLQHMLQQGNAEHAAFAYEACMYMLTKRTKKKPEEAQIVYQAIHTSPMPFSDIHKYKLSKLLPAAKKKSKSASSENTKPQAQTADKHALWFHFKYETCAKQQVAMLNTIYANTFASLQPDAMLLLHVDFCSVGHLCKAWVQQQGATFSSIGVDTNDAMINFASKQAAQFEKYVLAPASMVQHQHQFAHIFCVLDSQLQRITLRHECITYLHHIYQAMQADKSVFVFDLLGGFEMQRNDTKYKSHKMNDFTCEECCSLVEPISNIAHWHVQFKMADHSVIKEALQYKRRLYTIPECLDLLQEAGFAHVSVYWTSQVELPHEPFAVPFDKYELVLQVVSNKLQKSASSARMAQVELWRAIFVCTK